MFGKVAGGNLYKLTKNGHGLLTLAVKFDIINTVYMMAVLWNRVHSVRNPQT